MLDAICYGFKAVLLEDCTAAWPMSIHELTLRIFRRNALYPLLKVEKSAEMLSDLVGNR